MSLWLSKVSHFAPILLRTVSSGINTYTASLLEDAEVNQGKREVGSNRRQRARAGVTSAESKSPPRATLPFIRYLLVFRRAECESFRIESAARAPDIAQAVS